MREHGRADGAGPHAQSRGDVSRFRVSGQMFAQTSLVDVVLTADGAGMSGSTAFDARWR